MRDRTAADTPLVEGGARRLDGIECLRGLAASYVFFHHTLVFGIFPGWNYLQNVAKFGQAAVLIFFLISGFVVYYSTIVQNLSTRQYLKLRFRRIYPLFLIALLISWLSASAVNHGPVTVNTRELVVNLLLLQDRLNPGGLALPFMNNFPLWSLGYEWFFYMAFLPTLWLTAKLPDLAKYLVASLSILGFASDAIFPNQISLFLSYYVIWWAGAEMAREYLSTGRVTFRKQAFSFASIGLMALLWAVLARFTLGPHSYLNYPDLQMRHFLSVLAILSIGFAWYATGLKGYWRLVGWFRYLAPISYAIYVIHMPVLVLAVGLHPLMPLELNLVWVVPLVLALAWLMERMVQPWINRLLPVRTVRILEQGAAAE